MRTTGLVIIINLLSRCEIRANKDLIKIYYFQNYDLIRVDAYECASLKNQNVET